MEGGAVQERRALVREGEQERASEEHQSRTEEERRVARRGQERDKEAAPRLWSPKKKSLAAFVRGRACRGTQA